MKRIVRLMTMLAILFAVPLVRGQDTSHTAYRVIGGASLPGSCVYSILAPRVFIVNGTTLYICGAGGTYSAVGGGGGSGANVTLSNLTAPTAINVDNFVFTGAGGMTAQGLNPLNLFVSDATNNTAVMIGVAGDTGVMGLYSRTVAGSVQGSIYANYNYLGNPDKSTLSLYVDAGNPLVGGDGVSNTKKWSTSNVVIDDGTGRMAVQYLQLTPANAVSDLGPASDYPGMWRTVNNSTAVTVEGQICVQAVSGTNYAAAFSNGVNWKCF